MKKDFDDFQRFVNELTEAIEGGYIEENGEITSFDSKQAVVNTLKLLERWQLIFFENQN
jgi:hypothetical protein